MPPAAHSASVNYVESPPTGLITVNDFANYQVFQRDIDGTSKNVTISGTYADMNWSRVEARLLRDGTSTPVVDWTTIDPTYGGGTFSGNLTVPQGGWYNVEIRALNSSGSVIGSSRGANKWGLGMIILAIGQSNMSGYGQPPFTATASDLAVNYSNAGRWEHLADPYDDESPAGAVDNDTNAGGSMMPGIANSLLQTFDFPVAFVPAAKGWSNLYANASNGWAYRNPSNHFDTATLYGQSITKAQSVGGAELIVMHQGERDLSDGRTEANYEADFTTMIGNYRQDLYADIPIFICQLGTVGSGTNAGVVGIRNAQRDVDNGANIFLGATAMDQPRFDTWHYDTPQLNVIGSRVANAIKYYFGQSTYYRGPSIHSASFSDGNRDRVIVTLNHRGGTDITPATGISGFEVFDNGSPVTIQSAARYSAGAVLLTLSRSILSGHTASLQYLYGMTPNVSGLVKDNSPLMLPLENTAAPITVTDYQCYALTLGHNGQGSNPVAAPPNSAGCLVGQYSAGQAINLSGAVPAAGWQIGSWTGTANDSSTAGTNSLTMPAGVHSAAVNYGQVTVGSWTPIFKGIEQASGQTTVTAGVGNQVVHALRIDLLDPDVEFFSTSAITDNYLDGSRETAGLTTSHFLVNYGLQAAINANYFSPCCSQPEGAPFDVFGLAISEGMVVSAQDSSEYAASMTITNSNIPTVISPNWPPTDTGGIHTAVSGKYPLIVQGVNVGTDGEVHPRTALGYSMDKRYLILMTIDGRQPGYSDGSADANTASWMIRFGAYDAVNLDGGGSTTMAVSDGQGGATVLNRPIHNNIPGLERVVANHFGVSARPLPAGN